LVVDLRSPKLGNLILLGWEQNRRKIESVDCSKEFSQRNFTPADKINRGLPPITYEMTKDGFMFYESMESGPIG